MDGFKQAWTSTELDKYDIFINTGRFTGCKIPIGYRLIKVHIIFEVKVDSRHRVYVAVDVYLTAIPAEWVYCGVVSLTGFFIICVLLVNKR